MPDVRVEAESRWYPTPWLDCIDAVEAAGVDPEIVRSLQTISSNRGMEHYELQRLVKHAIELNDGRKINLPSWWLVEATKLTATF